MTPPTPSAAINTPATTAISRGTTGNLAGAATGPGTEEELARTVGEVAMMPRVNASGWPVRHVPTLANLQEERLNSPQSHPGGRTLCLSRKKEAARRCRTILWFFIRHAASQLNQSNPIEP